MLVFGARGGHPGPQQNLHRRKLTKAQSRGCGKLHHFLRECWAVPPVPQGENWLCYRLLVSWWVLSFLVWSLSGSFGVPACHQPARRVSQAILCKNHRVHISKERCGGGRWWHHRHPGRLPVIRSLGHCICGLVLL